jgi:ABC-type branched-subunit amino acid transport system ATPase component
MGGGRPAAVPPPCRARGAGVVSDIILRVENVSKRFAGRIALDSVSIDVARGSVTGVIGPNGSGKSTLFNIIAGTLRPDRGRVLVDGRDITLVSAAEICGLGVARTFQISRLFAEMTVLENLIAVARGSDDRAAIALALELLDFLEIADIADRWGSELSYGQRKLVEIARALMLQPKIMLLDEPFAGINPRLQNRIVEHLKALCAKGITVFFIDHEMRIVLKECEMVYVLAEGSLIAQGDTQTVRNDARVLQAYF